LIKSIHISGTEPNTSPEILQSIAAAVVLSIKQAEVFFKPVLYVLKGVKGEVPKIDKFSRRAVSFVMCFLQKAGRRKRGKHQ
jgi:hypothetical protein